MPFVIATAFVVTLLHADGFLKVSGTSIVDDKGQEVILRGMGIGGWLLPEGYMLHTEKFAAAFWQMKNKVIDVVGEQNADSFWTTYRKNFFTRKDAEQLSKWGFNSIRLVLHYEFFMSSTPAGYEWKDDGFVIVDSVLQWCGENKIYVILDLHAAPGGQSANNISDYNPANPLLWESEKNKGMTAALWKKLAGRYKNAPWMGGYDLLNEPAWNLPPENKPLRDLYVMITDSIRSVDTTHIIFIEGNWYATDFTGLTPAWDKNLVYSFHKYGNANDAGSMSSYINLRNSTQHPLWLGESGENSNAWFTDCISLMEENGIGWSWWTLKKFETVAGPLTVPITPEYDALLKYWQGEASKPSVENALKGLMAMAEGLKLENCVFHPDYIDAMMRQPYDNSSKPFGANVIPGRIFFSNYDLGKILVAYNDADYQNIGNTSWNNGWTYRNDGVDIEKCADGITNGYDVGWTESGEFLLYTVNVQQSGTYAITLRFAAAVEGGYIGLKWDTQDQMLVSIPFTGGWQTWQSQHAGDVELTAGIHKVRVNMFFGGFNLNFLDVMYTGPLSVAAQPKVPMEYALEQNFPNPFNPATVIRYQLPAAVHVSIKVYDMAGREAATLVNGQKSAGRYSVNFDAAGLSSGVYFYTLRAGSFVQTRKLVVLK